jgi:hypothetical protein
VRLYPSPWSRVPGTSALGRICIETAPGTDGVLCLMLGLSRAAVAVIAKLTHEHWFVVSPFARVDLGASGTDRFLGEVCVNERGLAAATSANPCFASHGSYLRVGPTKGDRGLPDVSCSNN